jgi:hypothetical protein
MDLNPEFGRLVVKNRSDEYKDVKRLGFKQGHEATVLVDEP